MKKIEFDGTTISVPQSWAELTLAQYELLTCANKDDAAAYLQLLATLCNTDADTLSGMPREVFDVVSSSLSFITLTEVEPSPTIEIDGVSYSVAQSDGLTLGEWVDINMIMSGDSPNKLADILSVVCRPQGEPYKADISASRRAMFASLPCDKALRPIGFFLSRKKKSDEILTLCSEVVAQADRFVSDTEHFVINGDGIKQLPIWQRIKYIFLMKYLKKQLSKFSDFSSTRSTKAAPKPTSTASSNR